MAYPLDFEEARRATAPFVIRTPLLRDPWLASSLGRDVFFKLENLQITGSFKVRGAANRILQLSHQERTRGVVACSSGNHGRAVAHVARALGIPATICVPVWSDPAKRAAILEDGADLVVVGASYDESAERAEEIREHEGRTLIHPFDDPRVIAGQGTVGIEIVEVLPDVSEIVVPLSGGGLAGGLATAAKQHDPSITITAVSAEKAAVMVASLDVGRPIEVAEAPTVASALSGGIDLENAYTFALVRDRVDRHHIVSEGAILDAMAYALRQLHMVVEGGGAVGLAAVLASDWPAASNRAGALVVVLSGGNLGTEEIRRVLDCDCAY